MTDFSKLGETFGQCFNVDFNSVGIFNFIVVIFSFLFVDLFDTLGTLIGTSAKAGMLDENGRLPKIKPALLADSIAKLTSESYPSAIPAYLCILTMPLFYSVSEGISFGVISYVILNLVCGKRKEIHPVMYVLALLFILKYIFL